MSLEKGKLQTLVYQYDFAEDGGLVSTISMGAATADGKVNTVEEGFVVTNWSLHVETALTSGGSPTLTLGDGDDPDGYATDIIALTASNNDMVNRGEVAGALVWDDTNDHEIHHRIGSTANNKLVDMVIGTAALTAGKFKLYLHGYRDFS